MSRSFRALAILGIVVLAVTGCEQTKKPGTTAKAESAGEDAGEAGKKAPSTKGTSTQTRSASASYEAHGGRRVSTLTADDDGGDFTFRQGQVFSVVLNANHASGLTWVMVDPTNTVIVREGAPVYVAKKDASGTETWHFRAARPGHQTVRLEYRRKWAQSVPDRAFRFTATVR
jgi:predicted secreted protein